MRTRSPAGRRRARCRCRRPARRRSASAPVSPSRSRRCRAAAPAARRRPALAGAVEAIRAVGVRHGLHAVVEPAAAQVADPGVPVLVDEARPWYFAGAASSTSSSARSARARRAWRRSTAASPPARASPRRAPSRAGLARRRARRGCASARTERSPSASATTEPCSGSVISSGAAVVDGDALGEHAPRRGSGEARSASVARERGRVRRMPVDDRADVVAARGRPRCGARPRGASRPRRRARSPPSRTRSRRPGVTSARVTPLRLIHIRSGRSRRGR